MTTVSPWVDAGSSSVALLMLLALAGYTLVVEPYLGIRFYQGFRRTTTAVPARRTRWFAALFAMQLAVLLVGIALVFGLPELSAASTGLRAVSVDDGFVRGALIGAGAGTVVALVATAIAARRGEPIPVIGDAGVLLPRSRRERGWLLAVAFGAGTSEELLYRGVLPALAVGSGVPVIIALAGQAVIFGLAHRYQGWSGVGATTLLGLAFGGLVVVTGSLLISVALHVLIDARLALSAQVRDTPRAEAPTAARE